MALERFDRIKETTTTTGTGTVSLSGTAPVGFLTFVTSVTSLATVRYFIESTDLTEWEVGEGVFTDGTPDTLSRVTVFASSNAGSLVDFSAGTKTASLSLVAEDLKQATGAEINTGTDDTKFATAKAIADSYLGSILSILNPIGTIREFAVSTNPATLLGFGTWVAHGTGRVTVGIDSGDADFDTVDETGGEKTHQLTEAELASHDHPGVTVALKNDNLTDGDKLHGGSDHAGTAGMWAPAVGDAGSDTAHNNVQPYIVVYRWVRVS